MYEKYSCSKVTSVLYVTFEMLYSKLNRGNNVRVYLINVVCNLYFCEIFCISNLIKFISISPMKNAIQISKYFAKIINVSLNSTLLSCRY